MSTKKEKKMNKPSLKKFCIALLGIANILTLANVNVAKQNIEETNPETTIMEKATQKMQEERKRLNQLYLPKEIQFEIEEEKEKSRKRKKENDFEM